MISKLLRFITVKQGATFFPGRETIDTTSNILNLMIDLAKAYPEDMCDNGNRLMQLWERMPDLNMIQYRLLMELFCLIAYPPPPHAVNITFEDNLNMLVKKQVASSLIL